MRENWKMHCLLLTLNAQQIGGNGKRSDGGGWRKNK